MSTPTPADQPTPQDPAEKLLRDIFTVGDTMSRLSTARVYTLLVTEAPINTGPIREDNAGGAMIDISLDENEMYTTAYRLDVDTGDKALSEFRQRQEAS